MWLRHAVFEDAHFPGLFEARGNACGGRDDQVLPEVKAERGKRLEAIEETSSRR